MYKHVVLRSHQIGDPRDDENGEGPLVLPVHDEVHQVRRQADASEAQEVGDSQDAVGRQPDFLLAGLVRIWQKQAKKSNHGYSITTEGIHVPCGLVLLLQV